MEPRLIVAYALILLLLVTAGWLVLRERERRKLRRRHSRGYR